MPRRHREDPVRVSGGHQELQCLPVHRFALSLSTSNPGRGEAFRGDVRRALSFDRLFETKRFKGPSAFQICVRSGRRGTVFACEEVLRSRTRDRAYSLVLKAVIKKSNGEVQYVAYRV